MTYNYFIVSIENKIANVIINRPEKANSFHMEAWLEMQMVFESLSETEEVRAIILSGNGKHFSSGIDLELLMSIGEIQKMSCSGKRSEKIRVLVKLLQNTITSIEKCTKPVLVAVHSGCIGGAVDIISACDMRYCSKDAYFTIKEIDLGMVADIGTLQRLPKLISPGMVAEMAYTGRKMYGDEAVKTGLVNQCFESKDELMENVRNIAAKISTKSPISIRGTKEILRYTRDHTVDDSLDYMSTWNAAMLLSEDLTEAFKALMEKRQPTFKD
jgi:enoyl-CoA hydratase